MADLIHRQVAIDEIREYKVEPSRLTDDSEIKGYNDGLDTAISVLAVLPIAQQCEYWDSESNYCALYRPSAQPADAVEVVRCKDCKHYQFADNRAFGFPVKRCEWTGYEDVDDDDFCSRGERKDG